MQLNCERSSGRATCPASPHRCLHCLPCCPQDASYVVRELFEAVAEAAQQYEASGPGPLRVPGERLGLQ